MRKTIGASRCQLLLQYLLESFLVVSISLILSLALIELTLPWFETQVGGNHQPAVL